MGNFHEQLITLFVQKIIFKIENEDLQMIFFRNNIYYDRTIRVKY